MKRHLSTTDMTFTLVLAIGCRWQALSASAEKQSMIGIEFQKCSLDVDVVRHRDGLEIYIYIILVCEALHSFQITP